VRLKVAETPPLPLKTFLQAQLSQISCLLSLKGEGYSTLVYIETAVGQSRPEDNNCVASQRNNQNRKRLVELNLLNKD